MAHFELQAYSADRVVIGVRNAGIHKKIFQINFKSKDGSLFVSFPYAEMGTGRVGVVDCPIGNPGSLVFGHSAPVTAHSVKYTHHPDGEAHFSLDGKVFTSVRKKAVPLSVANGHLFTVMVQGLHRFSDMSQNERALPRRGIVSLPIMEGHVKALKFVGHLYSSSLFAKTLQKPKMNSALIPVQRPDGRRLVAVVLATKLIAKTYPYLLVVSVEEIDVIAAHSELHVSLLGGFDPPDIVDDHRRTTNFLMMMYPEIGDVAALLGSVGSIDYSGRLSQVMVKPSTR